MICVRSSCGVIPAVLLLAMTRAVPAQSVGQMVAYDVLHAGGDIVGTWAAPFHSSAKNWLTAGVVVLGSAAISPLDAPIDNFFVRNHDSELWSPLSELREGGNAFSGKTITPIAAGVYVIGIVTKNRAIRDGVWGCVASYAAESVVRSQIMYRVIGRVRPDSVRSEHTLVASRQGDQYEFAAFPGNDWGKHSIPAGHVANVAACGSFLSHRFGNAWVTIPAYALVAGVGIGRMVDRRHWTSDTILGVLFGYAVGKEVGIRSLERRDRDEGAGGSANDDGGGLLLGSGDAGLLIGWRRTF